MTRLEDYIEQEQLVANRYRWWGVYLVYERRRLQVIADTVSNSSDDTTSVTRRPDQTEPHGVGDKLKGQAAMLGEPEEY